MYCNALHPSWLLLWRQHLPSVAEWRWLWLWQLHPQTRHTLAQQEPSGLQHQPCWQQRRTTTGGPDSQAPHARAATISGHLPMCSSCCAMRGL
jgi:hypothetical protein